MIRSVCLGLQLLGELFQHKLKLMREGPAVRELLAQLGTHAPSGTEVESQEQDAKTGGQRMSACIDQGSSSGSAAEIGWLPVPEVVDECGNFHAQLVLCRHV